MCGGSATSAIGLEDAGTAWKPPPPASSAYKTSNLPRTQILFFLPTSYHKQTSLPTFTIALLLQHQKVEAYTNTT
ncbi:hypothetical protein V492_04360 [Pseudogymnoascus sp. VKM F-4246]|nr:hypothetical protein V492_04360 [Pseudogymnoascus sp. VKM F-4246]